MIYNSLIIIIILLHIITLIISLKSESVRFVFNYSDTKSRSLEGGFIHPLYERETERLFLPSRSGHLFQAWGNSPNLC